MCSAMQVNVTVRTPSLTDSDLDLSCDLSWSVLRLKEEIEDKFESHPKPGDQRLVYAGKMLENHTQLGQVFRMDDKEIRSHIVHLVCRQMQHQPAQKKTPAQQPLAHAATTANLAQQETPAPTMAQSPSYGDFWAQAFHRQNAEQINNGAESHDQAYYFQQAYAQYMNQYMHYIQTAAATAAASSSGLPAMQAVQPAFIPVNENPVPFQNEAPRIPVEADGVRPAQQQAVGGVGGALGGAMEDEDDLLNGQRDVLDWFYIATRVVVLISIVYFYSSFTRFVLVTGFGVIAYLWNIGYFRREQVQQAEAVNEEEDLIRREVDQVRQAATGGGRRNEEDGEDTPAETNETNNDDNEGNNNEQLDENNVDQAVEVQSVISTAFTFVTTFFSSLLPEQPQVI